jgi:hypothetical protein
VKFSEQLIFDDFFDFLNLNFDIKTTLQVEKKIFLKTFVKHPSRNNNNQKIETITISYRAETFFSYPLFFKKLRQKNSKCEGEKFFLITFAKNPSSNNKIYIPEDPAFSTRGRPIFKCKYLFIRAS